MEVSYGDRFIFISYFHIYIYIPRQEVILDNKSGSFGDGSPALAWSVSSTMHSEIWTNLAS